MIPIQVLILPQSLRIEEETVRNVFVDRRLCRALGMPAHMHPDGKLILQNGRSMICIILMTATSLPGMDGI